MKSTHCRLLAFIGSLYLTACAAPQPTVIHISAPRPAPAEVAETVSDAPPLAGSYAPVTQWDDRAEEASELAKATIQQQYQVWVNVTKAEQQVVAGMNYRFFLNYPAEQRQFLVVVYSPLDGPLRVTETRELIAAE